MRGPDHPSDLMHVVNGFQLSQAIHVAATLKIADLLADGPRGSDDLAVKTETDAGALYRLLRTLAAAGVFREESEKRFSLTPLGEGLRSDAPAPVAPWAALIGRANYWQAWGDLLHSVKTGQNAFRHVHGERVWDYRKRHPEEGRMFNAAMTGLSRQVSDAVIGAYDFGSFGMVVDVGGGCGALLASILSKNPQPRGILFDQPHIVADAATVLREAGVAERCEIRSGNFFEKVPEDGDAYLLKAILHDWNDEDALKILRVCRAAIPSSGKLILVEQVLAPPNEGLAGKLSDLNMLVVPDGRERTAEEFYRLLDLAGFRLTSQTQTASAVSIIEAVPLQL